MTVVIKNWDPLVSLPALAMDKKTRRHEASSAIENRQQGNDGN